MSRVSNRSRVPFIVAVLAVGVGCDPAGQVPVGQAPPASPPLQRAAFTQATPPPCLDPGEPSEEAYYPATGPTDGEIILPNGRRLTPTGTQVTVENFPMNVVISPDGRYAYVTNNGNGDRSVQQIDIASHTVTATLSFENLFTGLAINAAGTRLYAAGGEAEELYIIDLGDPGMTLAATWELSGFPTGIALSPDGTGMLVTANLGGEVFELDASTGAERQTISTSNMPYQVVYSTDGTKAYVSQWSQREVSVIDLSAGRVTDTIDTLKNPSGMLVSPKGDKLYVAAADGDTIEVFSTSTLRLLGDVEVGSYADGLHGASPNSLALTTDGALLLVANAGDNAVEAYDPSTLAYQGAIPTGWYPSGLAVSPDGSNLVVVNGKGEGSGPNPDEISTSRILAGTVSFVSLPLTSSQLAAGDEQVASNNSRPTTLHEIDCTGKSFPIPTYEGAETPIEHVVFILRENKTYDAYLGDLEVGDGDPSMVLFDEQITPNTHQLAREFTVLDNFYTDSEDSDQGHLWTTASFVNDYSERIDATSRGLATGVGNASDPETLYIFDNLLKNGIDFVNYGEVVGLEFATARYIDRRYPGLFFNLNVKDQVKAEYVVKQISKGVMPTFTYLLLPCDHTEGTTPGELTPESMVSDNDYAVGLVVDAISKSEFWASTVIFILEDDPQDGADHVESHRSPALVVSPWTKRGHVSSVLYSIPSIHRTIEMILGIPALTQYDTLATPMYDCFTATPDYTPYDVIPRQIQDSYNTLTTVGAKESARMDFSGPDRAKGLGEVIWRYRKGTEPPQMFGKPLDRDLDDDDL